MKSAFKIPAFCAVLPARELRGRGGRVFVYHNATVERPVLKVWNESGTNRARIGDSRCVRFCSLRDIDGI